MEGSYMYKMILLSAIFLAMTGCVTHHHRYDRFDDRDYGYREYSDHDYRYYDDRPNHRKYERRNYDDHDDGHYQNDDRSRDDRYNQNDRKTTTHVQKGGKKIIVGMTAKVSAIKRKP